MYTVISALVTSVNLILGSTGHGTKALGVLSDLYMNTAKVLVVRKHNYTDIIFPCSHNYACIFIVPFLSLHLYHM